MAKLVIVVVSGALFCAGALQAADIHRSIIIQHTLTRKNVTANVSAYDRGINVALGSNPIVDPLSFERTHVMVFLEGEAPSPNSAPAVIEHVNRQFVPDLVAVPPGAAVSFPNFDPIFHNVFSLSKLKSFDLGNYSKDQTRNVTSSKPGAVFVNCRLHPNMSASIVVTPNRSNARPEASVLRHVPGGKQTVVAWRQRPGFFRKAIMTGDAHDATVTFEIPLDENSAAGPPSMGLR